MRQQVTKNFRLSEFHSKDGAKVPEKFFYNIVVLAHQLQALRAHIGLPVIINSGYRSPSHNKAVGGASRSYHLFGMAVDIRVPGMSPGVLYSTILKLIHEGVMQDGGLSLYGSFVHYDIRTNPTIF